MIERIREGDIPGVQLRLRQGLPLSVEQVWLRLTEAGLASRWIAERVSVLGEAGEQVAFESTFEGEELRERGTVEKSLPMRLWSISLERPNEAWPAPTRVTFELGSLAEGCELSILHEGFQRLSLSECLTIWEFYRRRWRWALDRLARSAAET